MSWLQVSVNQRYTLTNTHLLTSKCLKLSLEHELFLAQLQPLYPQTQPSHGASQPASLPSPPPLNLLSCLSAPLLLLPLFSLFFNTRQTTPPPLLFSLSSFCLPFSSPGSTLNHPPPPPCHLSLHSNECTISPLQPWEGGGLPRGWGGVKRRAAHMQTQIQSQNSLPPTSSLCVGLCVHICRGTQEHGGWQTGVGLGGVLMALSAGNGLLLHRQLQNQLSSRATSPYFICIGKTHTFTHSWAGSPPPPTNDYAKLQPTEKKQEQPWGKIMESVSPHYRCYYTVILLCPTKNTTPLFYAVSYIYQYIFILFCFLQKRQ